MKKASRKESDMLCWVAFAPKISVCWEIKDDLSKTIEILIERRDKNSAAGEGDMIRGHIPLLHYTL